MMKYIKEKSGCSDESYWKEFEPTFVTEVKNNCPNPCSSRGLPNATLELCETFVDWQCADKEFETNLAKTKPHQYSPCNQLEYEGRIVMNEHPVTVAHLHVNEFSFFFFQCISAKTHHFLFITYIAISGMVWIHVKWLGKESIDCDVLWI